MPKVKIRRALQLVRGNATWRRLRQGREVALGGIECSYTTVGVSLSNGAMPAEWSEAVERRKSTTSPKLVETFARVGHEPHIGDEDALRLVRALWRGTWCSCSGVESIEWSATRPARARSMYR